MAVLADASRDGLDPATYRTPGLQAALSGARTGDRASLARAEVALSEALSAYAVDLRNGVVSHPMAFVDPDLNLRPLTRRAALEEVAAASSPAEGVKALARMNPVYEALRTQLAAYRARWSKLPSGAVPAGPILGLGNAGPRVAALRRRLGLAGPGVFDLALEEAVRSYQSAHGLSPNGRADPQTLAALNGGPEAYERLILANLERTRILPPDPGPRFIVVDVAGQKLQLYENGQPTHAMDVAVGKPSEPTPEMAGLIRYAVFNPYWNVPPDLVRERVAGKVLAGGPAALSWQGMEALDDWSDTASVVDPGTVDWLAVASGRQILRVRQRPGPGNMMGRVKFMLPNPLGVYLHDTPKKSVFLAARRNVSAGCVRLADALSLARWLMPQTSLPAPADSESRVDLARPTPVYILYLTAAPTPDGLAFHRDVYGRDRALVARLERDGRKHAHASAPVGT